MSSNWVGCHFDTVQGIKGIPRLARALRDKSRAGRAIAELSWAEPSRRNRGGGRHDGEALLRARLSRRMVSRTRANSRRRRRKLEDLRGWFVADERTRLRWIDEEAWRDMLLPSRDVARFLRWKRVPSVAVVDLKERAPRQTAGRQP